MNLRQKYKAAKKRIMQLENQLNYAKNPFPMIFPARKFPIRYRVSKVVERRLAENPEYLAHLAHYMADDLADRLISDGLINPRISGDTPVVGMVQVTADLEVLP